MFQQQQQLLSQLPYQPIKFIYTQTIGSIKDKLKQILDPYTWQHQDIVNPKPINNINNNYIYYYLFHIPPIYNWLRKVESPILQKYLQGNIINNNKNGFSSLNNNNNSKMVNFDKNSFISNLKHYIAQWEIVKLSASAKIKIQSTKVLNNNQNNQNNNNSNVKKLLSISNINNNNNNHNKNDLHKAQVQQPSSTRCIHLIKKQKFSSLYNLNTFSTPYKLQSSIIYCQQCQSTIEIKSQILKYPFAPIFDKYHDKQFNLLTNLKYQLIMMFSKQKVYVKTATNVWYEITYNTVKMISYQKIQIKKNQLFVYQLSNNNHNVKVLKMAEMLKKKNQIKYNKIHNKIHNQSNQEDSYQEKYKQFQKLQNILKNNHNKNKQQQQNLINQQQKDQPQQMELQDMTKTPLPIIMNKKKTDRKVFKQYKKTVQSLLPKLKQKDAYQKDYDKGKTKKIHKNKQQFRTANFFNLYKDLNAKQQHLPQSSHNNHDEDQNQHKDNNRNKDNKVKNNDFDDDGDFQLRVSKKFQKRMNQKGPFRHGHKKGDFQKGNHFKKGSHSHHKGPFKKNNFKNK